MEFKIKNEDTQVRINILYRPYSDSKEYWDLNWLSCQIFIKIPGFIADFPLYIRTDELNTFYNGLKKMSKNLRGLAVLSTMEEGILIKSEINKLGKIEWIIATQYPIGIGAELSFRFENDQSYLPEILGDLKKITDEYPVINV